MKPKLTIAVDRDLRTRAKAGMRRRGTSISALVGPSLREASQAPAASFAERWRGAFEPACRPEVKYRRLAHKHR